MGHFGQKTVLKRFSLNRKNPPIYTVLNGAFWAISWDPPRGGHSGGLPPRPGLLAVPGTHLNLPKPMGVGFAEFRSAPIPVKPPRPNLLRKYANRIH